jgi:hypothetical protein
MVEKFSGRWFDPDRTTLTLAIQTLAPEPVFTLAAGAVSVTRFREPSETSAISLANEISYSLDQSNQFH